MFRDGKVLLTGGSGFLGQRIAAALLANGAEVAILTRPSTRLPADIKAETQSVSLTSLESDSFLEEVDAVIHLAATMNHEDSSEALDAILESGLRLPVQLLRLCAEHKVDRFLAFGSYWQTHDPGCLHANSVYAATKTSLLPFLRYFAARYRMRSMSIRLPDIYSEEDERPKLLNALRDASDGDPFDLTGGDQVINPLHVDDVVSAVELALQVMSDDMNDGEVREYSIYGEACTLRHYIEKFCAISGKDLQLNWGERAYDWGQVFEPTLLEKLPGWEQRVNLDSGFTKFIT